MPHSLLADIQSSLDTNIFVKLSLGHYTGREKDLKTIHIRRITVKRQEKLSFTYRYKTRDIVKNFDIDAALGLIGNYLGRDFQSAALFTTQYDLKLENGKIKKSPPSQTDIPSTDHDRAKNRLVTTSGKPYLHALGITDDKGTVTKTAQDKYRQIDKFVEIVAGLIKDIPPGKIRKIADMGSGKGYLTFALYDYLTDALKMPIDVIGVEARPDMVTLCNRIAADSNYDRLTFSQGTIEKFDASGTNILIALHACDTATDDALFKGIKAGAEIIVVAPCCHKQIRREMEKGGAAPVLAPLLRHGIFMERQAEMVTDTLRALILEYFGYQVKVFEFIGGEHTAKNVMLTATKTAKGKKTEILKTIAETKQTFGLSRHALEDLMEI
ncbi:MAG: SAM-dependent methyltransferase [Alphaproteobacteria bacterium]